MRWTGKRTDEGGLREPPAWAAEETRRVCVAEAPVGIVKGGLRSQCVVSQANVGIAGSHGTIQLGSPLHRPFSRRALAPPGSGRRLAAPFLCLQADVCSMWVAGPVW